MSQLVWDQIGERFYETGVDHGVLYIPDGGGNYTNGVAWNGLTTVTEAPSGAEANPMYADNIKYLNLISAEEFGATIEAYTYPDEFAQFDGMVSPTAGVVIGQQGRKTFGLCFRTRIGNDIDGTDLGYKLHLVYGAVATPSEKAYNTINDSPEAITFSWELTTTPVAVPGFKPTAILTVDSTKVNAGDLADLEEMLYGTVGTDPSLPLPAAVIALFDTVQTVAEPTEPAYNAGTHTITIPAVTGITYFIDGIAQVAGAVVIAEDTIVTAQPNDGYTFPDVVDNTWFYNF